MTLTEAADLLCISAKSAQRYAEAGKLPGAYKLVGVWRVSRDVFDRFTAAPQSWAS